MNTFELGKKGEQIIYQLFKNKKYQIQSPDFFVYSKEIDKYICIEVKFKNNQFKSQYFNGYGINKNQIYLRNKLFEKTNIRTFIIIVDNTIKNIYGQYLDILQKGKFINTKDTTIYDLNSYLLIKKGIDFF